MSELKKFVDLVHEAQKIALATHIVPDPDAIGSASALGLVLTSMGKDVVILCDDPVPSDLRWIPGTDLFTSKLPDEFSPQLFIGLDSSDGERLGKVSQPLMSGELPVVVIDHHVTNLYFGTVNIVDAETAATSELLVKVIESLGVELTPEIATSLAAALVGDTRAFSTASVTPQTLTAAAKLTESGADISRIIELVFTNRSFDQLRLWGFALDAVKLDDGVIWTELPYKKRAERGLLSEGVKGVSNLLLSAKEAHISASFMEKVDGKVEISFRSRVGYDVAQIALALGGGGHMLASGCTIDGPLEEAVARVVPLLKAEIAEQKQNS